MFYWKFSVINLLITCRIMIMWNKPSWLRQYGRFLIFFCIVNYWNFNRIKLWVGNVRASLKRLFHQHVNKFICDFIRDMNNKKKSIEWSMIYSISLWWRTYLRNERWNFISRYFTELLCNVCLLTPLRQFCDYDHYITAIVEQWFIAEVNKCRWTKTN